ILRPVASSAVITAGTLVMEASGSIGTQANPLYTDVSTVAAKTAGGGIYLNEKDTSTGDGLTVGFGTSETTTNALVTGLDASSTNADVAVRVDNVDLTLNRQVNAGSGQIRLQTVAGNVVQGASGVITASALGVNASGG